MEANPSMPVRLDIAPLLVMDRLVPTDWIPPRPVRFVRVAFVEFCKSEVTAVTPLSPYKLIKASFDVTLILAVEPVTLLNADIPVSAGFCEIFRPRGRELTASNPNKLVKPEELTSINGTVVSALNPVRLVNNGQD